MIYLAPIMNHHEDPKSLLESLRAEQRELLTEADGLRRFTACMRKLIDVSASYQRDSEVYRVFEQVLDNPIGTVNASAGSILVPDPESGELVFVMARGVKQSSKLIGRRLNKGEGIAGWTAQNRRAAIVNNVAADDRFFAGIDEDLQHRTRSILSVPVIGGDKVLAVIQVLNKRDRRLFSVGNKTLLGLMCRFAGEVLNSLVRDVNLSKNGAFFNASRVHDSAVDDRHEGNAP